METEARELRRVFSHLKRGVFPPAHIESLTFGRTPELAAVGRELDAVQSGSSSHLFVEGAYGRGKSHFLKAVESLAEKRGFAVSWVTLDGARHACNHPTRYLHSLLENLRVPDIPVRGLAAICRAWLRAGRRAEVVTWAKRSPGWWPAWAIQAMDAVGHERNGESSGIHERLECRDLAHRGGRSYLGEVGTRLTATAELCRVGGGAAGVVYLFDELESVATLLGTNRQRWLSYEVLNMFVDGRRHKHCMFVFAGTPDFGSMVLQDHDNGRCAREYPEGGRFSQKWREGSLSTLSLPPVSRGDLVVLCTHLAKLHAVAYGWGASSWNDPALANAFLVEAEMAGLGMRDLVRAFVHLLEVAEQHREINVPALLGLAQAVSQNDLSPTTAREEEPNRTVLMPHAPTVGPATEAGRSAE